VAPEISGNHLKAARKKARAKYTSNHSHREPAMNILEIEPLDLGPDVRAISLELVDSSIDREPIRGEEAARTWARILPALAGNELLGFDFFSHLDRVRHFCLFRKIAYREAADRCIVIPAPEPAPLEELLARFEAETFGARAGARVAQGDPALEEQLARRGADAYHHAFQDYVFCAICDFENGMLVVLSNTLWANQIMRLLRGVLDSADVEVRLPA
jgi:hypothetical protein